MVLIKSNKIRRKTVFFVNTLLLQEVCTGIEHGSLAQEASLLSFTPQSLGKVVAWEDEFLACMHWVSGSSPGWLNFDISWENRTFFTKSMKIKKKSEKTDLAKLGGTGHRSPGLSNANRTLYHWAIPPSMPKPGFEPGTFRSSVWRSPNWAIWALHYSMFHFL